MATKMATDLELKWRLTQFYELATTLKYLRAKLHMEKRLISCPRFVTLIKQCQVKNFN